MSEDTKSANYADLKAIDDDYRSKWNNQLHQSTCPSCGYCPTCGRGGYHTYPYPYWPYQPYITWTTGGYVPTTTSTGQPGDSLTTGTITLAKELVKDWNVGEK